MSIHPKQPSLPQWLWALVAATAIIVLLSGYGFLQMETRQFRAEAEANLAAIARLKVQQIADWRRERLSDASAFSDSPPFITETANWLKARQPEGKAALLARLKALELYAQYNDACLVDPTGQPLLSLSGDLAALDSTDLATLAEAFRRNRPTFGDLHRTASGVIDLDVIAPLLGSDGRPLGAILLKIDPQSNLYPLLQTWPIPSATAETLLVHREGDEVVWLNSLRFKPDAALTLKMPITATQIPAVMAVLGQHGTFRGTDYRGVDVFSALEAIPDSPWYLVAKEDTSEALTALPTLTALVTVSLASLLTAVLVAVGLAQQQAQKRYYQGIYAAEAQRLALARHFEYLVKYANDMILLTDADLRVVEANDRALETYGYTREAMLQLTVNDLIAPAEAARGVQRQQELRSTGAFIYESLHRRRDGSTFPVEVSAREIVIEGRRFYQGIQRDITERVRAEQARQEAAAVIQSQNETLQSQNEELQAQQEELQHIALELRESEARFRSLFGGMTEGVALHELSYDPDGRAINYQILDTNPQYEAILNVRREAVIHRLATEVYGTPEAPYLAEYSRVVETGEPYHFETYFPHLAKHFFISVARLAPGRFATLFFDITERKQAEEALANTQTLLEQTFEQSPIPMVLVSLPDGVFRMVNPACREFLGTTAEPSLIGTPLSDYHESYKDYDRAGQPGALQDLPLARAIGGEKTLNEDRLIVRKDGTHRWGLVSAAPIVNLQGERIAAYLIMTDITERRQIEAALRESEARLSVIFNNHHDLQLLVALEPDDNFRMVAVNQQYIDSVRAYGYDVSVQKLVGQTLASALRLFGIEGELYDRTIDRYRQAARTGQPVHYVEDLVTPTTHYFSEVTLMPVLDETGACTYVLYTSHDITQRNQAEAALAQERALLRTLLDSLPDSIFFKDAESRFTRVSPAMARRFGLSDPAKVVGRTDFDFFDQAHAAEAFADEQAILQTGEPIVGKVEREVWPSGPVQWALTTKMPLRDAAGRIVGTFGLARDITEQKRVEEALRESETRFRAIFEQAAVGAAQVNSHTGEFIRINQKHCDILGYTQEEMLRLNFQAITYPDDLAPDLQNMQRLLAGEIRTFAMEKRFVRKGGALIWVSLTISPLWAEGAEPDYHISIVEDITERKAAEAALRESETRFRAIFEQAAVGVAQINTQTGAYIRINQKHCDILGYAREEMLRMNFQAITYPNDLAPDLQNMQRLLAGEIRTFAMEKRYYRKDGTIVWVSLTVSPLWAEGAEPDYHIAVVQDITERKQTELLIQHQQDQLTAQNEELIAQNEELAAQGVALAHAEASLQRTNADLEVRIQARSAELQAANADLQLANAALLRAGRLKDEFLANMSHELRTPLTGILGLAEVMEKGIYGSVTEKQSRSLRLIQSSGEHLLELINDILDLSKIEAGKLELQLDSLLVEDVCQTSLEFVQQAARQKNIRWSFRQDSRVTQVIADSRRLKQMLVNLLSNAVKFTSEGGQVGLEVEGDPSCHEVRFTVWDTGIGIPPEQQRYLFQPFVQLDGSLARKYEGTGLGLALVNSLAELHGGRAAVESAGAGQGARFTVTLPWTEAHTPAATPAHAAGSAAQRVAALARQWGRPPVILAVDDSPVTLMVVSNFLEAADCQVLNATNGAEALKLAYSARPDLMLLDIQMPEVDGLTVLRELRAHWHGPALPIIVLTALAMSGDRERYLAAGANDYLSKPMNLNELALAVARQLERKEAPQDV
jgi:PAS domain S-box-containing protein